MQMLTDKLIEGVIIKETGVHVYVSIMGGMWNKIILIIFCKNKFNLLG